MYRSLHLEVDRAAMAARGENDDRIPMVISSEYRALQPDAKGAPYWETLDHEPDAVDLTRFQRGLPLMAVTEGFEHENGRQVGVVEDPHLGADRKLRALARFSRSAFAQEIKQDVLDGIRQYVSPGYRVYRMRREQGEGPVPAYRVTRWEPYEVSLVPSPADPTVGVGRKATTATFPVEVEGEPAITGDPAATRDSVGHITKQDDAPAVEQRAEQDTPAPKAKERAMSDEVAGSAAPAHKPGLGAVNLNEKMAEMAEISRVCAAHGAAERAAEFIAQGRSLDSVKAELFDEKVRAARPVTVPGHLDLSDRDAAQFSFTRAIQKQMDQSWERDGGFEKEVSDAVAKRTNRQTSGFFVPLDLKLQTRAAVTGNVAGTTSLGGAGVQTTVLSLIDLLRNRMLIRQLGARVLSGLQGNITFPRQITANTMAWEGENPSTAHANTAATLDNVTLSPKTAMASSAYSRQLLVQNSFDVNLFIQDDLAKVLALGLDLAAIDGLGSSNQPTGIMRQTGVNTATFTGTNGGVPTWAELVQFETEVAVDNADIGTIHWVTTPRLRGKLKTVLKTTTAGSTFLWEADQTINGYPAHATSQMPSNFTAGTNTTVAHGVLFGVFSEAMIGEWGGAAEFVIDPFTSAKQNMVEITAMLMADIAVRHPAAFCVNKTALIA